MERAYRQNPDVPLFAHLADLYLRRDMVFQALALCEEGCKRFPDYTTGYMVLSKCYEVQENFEDARRAMDQALRLDPENPGGFMRLSRLYQDLKIPTLALKSLQQAVRLDPFNKALNEQVENLATAIEVQTAADSGETEDLMVEEIADAADESPPIEVALEVEESYEAESLPLSASDEDQAEQTLDEPFVQVQPLPEWEEQEEESGPDQPEAADQAQPEEASTTAPESMSADYSVPADIALSLDASDDSSDLFEEEELQDEKTAEIEDYSSALFIEEDETAEEEDRTGSEGTPITGTGDASAEPAPADHLFSGIADLAPPSVEPAESPPTFSAEEETPEALVADFSNLFTEEDTIQGETTEEPEGLISAFLEHVEEVGTSEGPASAGTQDDQGDLATLGADLLTGEVADQEPDADQVQDPMADAYILELESAQQEPAQVEPLADDNPTADPESLAPPAQTEEPEEKVNTPDSEKPQKSSVSGLAPRDDGELITLFQEIETQPVTEPEPPASATAPPRLDLEDPEGRIATETLAEIYSTQGLVQRAIETYEKILEQQPENEEIKQKLADLEQRAGKQ